jgi:hypothetical protein
MKKFTLSDQIMEINIIKKILPWIENSIQGIIFLCPATKPDKVS